MEKFTIRRDGVKDLNFTGEMIASASSLPDTATSGSDSTQRWKIVKLYITDKGKFICEQIDKTRLQDEQDRYSAEICNTELEVIEFFGHDWLAKKLYAEAKIDDSEEE